MLKVLQDFHRAKNFGLAGVIIVLVAMFANYFFAFTQLPLLLSYILTIVTFVGWACIAYSLYLFSKFYQEEAIFKYALYFIALILVGGILMTLMGAAALASLAGGASISSVAGTVLLALIILIVILIAAYYFMYKSLSILAEKSGEKLFRISGILMLVGAATIIIVIGAFALLAGMIVLAIAFTSIKPPTETVQPPTPEHGAGEEPRKQQPESM